VYYQVDGIKTQSRNEAMILAGGDISRIYFYFMDDTWKTVDWNIEPIESFDILCEKRCRQLREKFDWVCVWTSGGYDTQTVLESFIRSGARIDEIAFMDRKDYYDDPEIPIILENAVFYQKYHNSNLKISPIKIDYDYTDKFYQRLKSDWVLSPGVSFRFSKSTASYVHQFSDHLNKIKSNTQGRRVDIYGKEKALLDLRDGQWYMIMIDLAITDNMNTTTEYFFITPDLPELHVKQCYLAMQWFEQRSDLSHEFVHHVQSHVAEHYQSWNLGMGRKQTRCSKSVDALTKRYFLQNDKSFESKKLLNHAVAEKRNSYNLYQQGVLDLRRVLGDGFKQGVKSKEWYIRPCRSTHPNYKSLIFW